MNEISFCAGRRDIPEGIGGFGICVDDVVDCITLEDDGSYTIEFSQYMSDMYIKVVQ